MTRTTQIFNGLLLTIIFILTVMSSLALIAIHWTLSKNSFSFTPTGLNNYLSAVGEYESLFTGTIATVAAYFGLLRLKATTDATLQKVILALK